MSSLQLNNNYQKPLLKWCGGKTQIINKIMDKFPKKINNYYEPFLGGGSVLLALLSSCSQNNIEIIGNIYVYDKNDLLINIYKDIQNNAEELISHLCEIINIYSAITVLEGNRKPTNLDEAQESKESYYYYIRNEFNKIIKNKKGNDTIKSSAYFIFLNKTCFRGVYREGPNGFNVPFGHYKQNINIDLLTNEINNINNLIQCVIFECKDFKDVLNNNFEEDDFIYLDPPYYPIDEKSFVGYTKDGFNEEEHNSLFELIDNLNNENVNLMLSNSCTEKVKNHFNNEKNYEINEIDARRAINSKNPESKVKEVIVMNIYH